MIKSRWFYHPLFIFIFSLIALGASLVIYIRSYLRVNSALKSVVLKYNLSEKQMFDSETWVLILVLSILVAIILAGLFIIYIYYQKMIQLYHLQQNFINGFTHELKTPIASLQIFLETFSRHELSRPDQLKYLDFMKRDIKRISDNVTRILHLGRLEDKSFKADFKERDFILLIKNLLNNTPHLFEEGQISFETSLDSIILKLDEELIEMLIMNLLINGLTYNNSSDKKIKIELKKIENRLFLNIIDNGVGLDPSQVKKIFKKFYQIGKSTKGSGLGLFIVQNVARLHNAHVTAFNNGNNPGSTFQVVFNFGKIS
jgi:signal transduction histidine kinase